MPGKSHQGSRITLPTSVTAAAVCRAAFRAEGCSSTAQIQGPAQVPSSASGDVFLKKSPNFTAKTNCYFSAQLLALWSCSPANAEHSPAVWGRTSLGTESCTGARTSCEAQAHQKRREVPAELLATSWVRKRPPHRLLPHDPVCILAAASRRATLSGYQCWALPGSQPSKR